MSKPILNKVPLYFGAVTKEMKMVKFCCFIIYNLFQMERMTKLYLAFVFLQLFAGKFNTFWHFI